MRKDNSGLVGKIILAGALIGMGFIYSGCTDLYVNIGSWNTKNSFKEQNKIYEQERDVHNHYGRMLPGQGDMTVAGIEGDF